jgi:solute carrier family 25 S-adenosylmethionine transporter 26
VPSSGVFLTTYEGLKSVLGGSSFLPQPAVHALSSSIAQLANCAVVAPAEVLKQNAQTLASASGSAGDGKKKKGAPSATMTVMRQLRRHPTKLWRGYSALVARDLPFTALQFPAFEYLKEGLIGRQSRRKKDGDPAGGVFERAWIAAVSAGVAGSAAAWVTTPFDVVKTRMMLEAGAKDERVDCSVNGRTSAKSDFVGRKCAKNGFQVGAEVLQREGVKGLF